MGVFQLTVTRESLTSREDKKTKSGFSTIFRGGPLDGQKAVVARLAFYRGMDGRLLRRCESKLKAYIGATGQIDGIYCLDDEGEYRWVWAHREGVSAHERQRAFTLEKQRECRHS